MKVKGIGNLVSTIESITNKAAPSAYVTALAKFLLKVENESSHRVPKNIGTLRDSALGNSKVTQSGPLGATGEVKYTAEYAIPVHEITTSRHTVGEAKFLENAVKHVSNIMGNDLAESLRTEIFFGQYGKRTI